MSAFLNYLQVPIPDRPQCKADLRLRARRHLATLDARAKREESECLCSSLRAWLDHLPDGRCVAIFAALADEPDLARLHQHRPGLRWVYPLVPESGPLSFHRVDDPSELMSGHFGIREPEATLHPGVEITKIDLFLCPGLAFDTRGARLGRGAGHYDRALAKALPGTPRVGVHFSNGLLDAVPLEPHDVPMTHLAGPRLGVRPGSS